jgi:hypothetical protein
MEKIRELQLDDIKAVVGGTRHAVATANTVVAKPTINQSLSTTMAGQVNRPTFDLGGLRR